MIDLDEEQARMEAMLARRERMALGVTCTEMIELITRLRQAEKDAARYRWLRDSASTENHGGLAYDFRLVDAIRYMPGAAPNETLDIDEAIDEVMKCNK